MGDAIGKTVNILGIRGVPAAHGGFETFAGQLAPFLRDRGWRVRVYCQLDPGPDGSRQVDFQDEWNGIQRIHFATGSSSSLGSIGFDWRCVQDAMKSPGVNLVLGYNTAIFSLLLRLSGRPVVMNMDGIEWKRAKWSLPIKAWFYLNEFIGANTANVPIADHPEIARHLRRHGCNRAVVIPYGAEAVADAPHELLAEWGVTPDQYFVSIARIEPENSILEMVRAYSGKPRSTKLVVLGKFQDDNAYHRAVRAAASDGVIFPGAIYDRAKVEALRFHARGYLHGHQVGGTNPSLVEALGAGSAIIAHDNRFNRWVAGEGQFYFSDEVALGEIIDSLESEANIAALARAKASARHATDFTPNGVNAQYERLLARFA